MLGGGRGQPQRQSPQQGGGGGLGDILNDMLGGGRGQPQRQSPQQGGGGLGDILNDMLGGGRGQPQAQRQAPQGNDIDRLREVLSDLITGGQQGGGQQGGGQSYEPPARRAPAPEPAPQQMPRGDGGIGDILRDILGGAPPRQPPQGGQPDAAPQRSPLDDIFGTPSRSAADDLLDSVQRRLGRR
jgi:hypothetical protein